MGTLTMTALTIGVIGMLAFGIFVVTKRQESAIDLQKEMVELLKRVAENTKGT